MLARGRGGLFCRSWGLRFSSVPYTRRWRYMYLPHMRHVDRPRPTKILDPDILLFQFNMFFMILLIMLLTLVQSTLPGSPTSPEQG